MTQYETLQVLLVLLAINLSGWTAYVISGRAYFYYFWLPKAKQVLIDQGQVFERGCLGLRKFSTEQQLEAYVKDWVFSLWLTGIVWPLAALIFWTSERHMEEYALSKGRT